MSDPAERCNDCGLPRREHHHDGAAYGICGQFSEVGHSPSSPGSARLRHVRIKLPDANAFVAKHHRHHKPVVGHLFSIGVVLTPCGGECVMAGCPPNNCRKLVGVAIIGRPVARMRDDGMTAEVTRLCTDGTRNACSFLYGASARAAFALGFQRIGTYILASETGGTLNAAGWRMIGQTAGGSWSRPSRSRDNKHPTEPKTLFEVTA